MTETMTDQQDSAESTLLTQEQAAPAGEQQPEEQTAADSGEESSQSENAGEAVIEKRLRDTQAKVTELAESLKAAQAQLAGQLQQRQEPFDENKFIDDFVGGEEAYNKYRDDPALLAKDLARKLLYHNAQVLVDRDKHWETKLNAVVNGLKSGSPEYAQYASEIKEIEENFDLSAMTADDKVKLAKLVRGKRGASPAAPPPGPRASKAAAPARKSAAPAGYFEMLGLVGEGRSENTLL